MAIRKVRKKNLGVSHRLAAIVGTSAGTIRGRIKYHNLSIRKSAWGDILKIFSPKEIAQHGKALESLRAELYDVPPAVVNPLEDTAAEHEVNVPFALLALMRADRAIGPLTVGEYSRNDVASGVADAIRFLGGIPESRHKKSR